MNITEFLSIWTLCDEINHRVCRHLLVVLGGQLKVSAKLRLPGKVSELRDVQDWLHPCCLLRLLLHLDEGGGMARGKGRDEGGRKEGQVKRCSKGGEGRRRGDGEYWTMIHVTAVKAERGDVMG